MAKFDHENDGKNSKIQQKNQGIGESYFKKAIDHHIRGDLSAAERTYRKAIDCGVSNAAIFLNLGFIYQATQRTEEAITHYKKAISMNLNQPEAYTNLGSLYQQIGSLNQALKFTLKSLELNPDNPTAHMNLGIIYKGLGNLDKALASILKSLALNPNNSTALMNLGGIYKDLGNLDKALASILKSLAVNPDNPNAHMNLGSIYDSLENPHQALASTLRSLELKPDNHTAYTNLGSIYLKLKDQDQALKSILKSLKINPTNSDAMYILSNIKLQHGELEEAQKSIIKAININPNKVLYQLFLGLILCAKGDVTQAIESQKATLHSKTLSKEDQFYAFALSSSIHTLKEEKNAASTSKRSVKFPIILHRSVEPKLLKMLYELKSIDLNNVADPTFGEAKGSTYNFFKDNNERFQYLEKELVAIIKISLNSEIFIQDSFYTILNGDSIVKRHNHLTDIDKIKDLRLGQKKFALVYYLETGDQECSEPGVLKFYEPEQELLPFKGMVIIFPGGMDHSAKYNGKKDRVIIGLNFYIKDISAIKSLDSSIDLFTKE